jgi:hypothetical protein
MGIHYYSRVVAAPERRRDGGIGWRWVGPAERGAPPTTMGWAAPRVDLCGLPDAEADGEGERGVVPGVDSECRGTGGDGMTPGENLIAAIAAAVPDAREGVDPGPVADTGDCRQ